MKVKMEYRLVSDQNFAIFINLVNDALDKGGQPVGGVYVDVGHGNYPYKQYYQAMLVPDEDES